MYAIYKSLKFKIRILILLGVFQSKKNDSDSPGALPSLSPVLSLEGLCDTGRLSLNTRSRRMCLLKRALFQDVAVASLLVSSKLEDTLKKLREIQVAAYQIKAAQEGLGNALLEPDPSLLEADRARLIGIERLILETISFNFNLRSSAAYASREATSPASQNQDVFAYVVKFGHLLGGALELHIGHSAREMKLNSCSYQHRKNTS